MTKRGALNRNRVLMLWPSSVTSIKCAQSWQSAKSENPKSRYDCIFLYFLPFFSYREIGQSKLSVASSPNLIFFSNQCNVQDWRSASVSIILSHIFSSLGLLLSTAWKWALEWSAYVSSPSSFFRQREYSPPHNDLMPLQHPPPYSAHSKNLLSAFLSLHQPRY